ncbi:MAG: hypothetical protein P9L99_14040 [Candidatus Lernaella stagnicola]|nr:hypothetical protein [Candidatus Lernaella stagnicola]
MGLKAFFDQMSFGRAVPSMLGQGEAVVWKCTCTLVYHDRSSGNSRPGMRVFFSTSGILWRGDNGGARSIPYSAIRGMTWGPDLSIVNLSTLNALALASAGVFLGEVTIEHDGEQIAGPITLRFDDKAKFKKCRETLEAAMAE